MKLFKLCCCLFFLFIVAEVQAVSVLKNKALVVSGNSLSSSTTAFSVTANRVGVRTGIPGTTLDINTWSSLSSDIAMRLYGSDAHYLFFVPSLGLSGYNSLTQLGDTGIFFSGGSGLIVGPWYSASVGIRMNAAGDIGIGTHSPSGKLHVLDTYAGVYTNYDELRLYATSSLPDQYPYIGWFDSTGTRGAYFGWGSTASNYLELCMENGNNLYIAGGNVGIGITNTVYPLDVQRYYTVSSTGAYGYLNSAGSHSISSGININYGINAVARIRSTEFNSVSDSRIKEHVLTANSKEDLQKISQLRVIQYRYIDTLEKGPGLKYGFIAQDVEKILPEAVHQNQDFIPDIFEKALTVQVDSEKKQLTVTTQKSHGLKVGDRVRVMCVVGKTEARLEKSVAAILSEHTFVLSEWADPVDALFVYGKRVDDFRVIDYAQVFSSGVSAIQALAKTIDSQEKIIHAQNKAIQALTLRLKKLKKTRGGSLK